LSSPRSISFPVLVVPADPQRRSSGEALPVGHRSRRRLDGECGPEVANSSARSVHQRRRFVDARGRGTSSTWASRS
jgi:hypothetical protein